MLAGILIFLVALVALLAMPLTLLFRVDWPERRNNDVRVVWAFGLVNVRVSESEDDEDDDDSEPEPDEDDDQADDDDARSHRKPLAAIRYRPFRRRVFRFVRELWRAARKEDVFLNVRLGLGDPAETGQLWAWLGPLSAFLMYAGDARVNLVPDFRFQRFDVDTGGRIRVIPLQIIGLALGLAVSPAFWRGLRMAKGAS